MADVVQVTVTIDSREAAAELARAAVEKRLVACAQVTGPITSTYRWQGAVESAEEWVLVCKTAMEVYPRLEAFLRDKHPYDVPEILVSPVVAGNGEYLSWVREETLTSAES